MPEKEAPNSSLQITADVTHENHQVTSKPVMDRLRTLMTAIWADLISPILSEILNNFVNKH